MCPRESTNVLRQVWMLSSVDYVRKVLMTNAHDDNIYKRSKISFNDYCTEALTYKGSLESVLFLSIWVLQSV